MFDDVNKRFNTIKIKNRVEEVLREYILNNSKCKIPWTDEELIQAKSLAELLLYK